MINDIKTDCGPASGISIEENMFTYPFAPSHPMSFKPPAMWLPFKRHRYSRIRSADIMDGASRRFATKRERVRVRIGVNDEMVSVTWNAVLELEVGHGAKFPHVLTVRVSF